EEDVAVGEGGGGGVEALRDQGGGHVRGLAGGVEDVRGFGGALRGLEAREDFGGRDEDGLVVVHEVVEAVEGGEELPDLADAAVAGDGVLDGGVGHFLHEQGGVGGVRERFEDGGERGAFGAGVEADGQVVVDGGW